MIEEYNRSAYSRVTKQQSIIQEDMKQILPPEPAKQVSPTKKKSISLSVDKQKKKHVKGIGNHYLIKELGGFKSRQILQNYQKE